MRANQSIHGAMDLTTALERFLAQLRADGRSSHTMDQYRRHILLFARWGSQVGDVREIDHETLARFLGSAAALTGADGRPKKASSVNSFSRSSSFTSSPPTLRKASRERWKPRSLSFRNSSTTLG